MGLLPTHASDWLAFIEPPEVRLMFQANGMYGSSDGRIRVGVESSLNFFFRALFLHCHVYCMPLCVLWGLENNLQELIFSYYIRFEN